MDLSIKDTSRARLWSWLILGLAVLIYGYSLHNGFIWDDNNYVWRNPAIKSWTGIKDIWFNNKIGEYYPITFSVIWLEHKLWGISPWGYHAASLAFHILNALLLFGLLRKIAPRFAGMTALLFTLHPIQVETVAWISEQKNLLSFFFFLLAFHAFVDFDARGKKTSYAASLSFFILAILSKSPAVCFAFIPLLWGWWKRGSLGKRDCLLALPFFAMGGINSLLHLHLLNIYSVSPQIPELPPNIIQKILNAGRIFSFYIQQTIFPRNFMTFYPKWTLQESHLSAWLYPVGTLAAYFTLFWKRHTLGRGAFTLLCFYGLSLFPLLGFFNFAFYRFSYVADHFSYLSIPAVLLLLCSGSSLLLEKVRALPVLRSWSPSLFLKNSLFAALIIYLSLLSFRLTLNYKDSITLWGQLLRQNPESSFAYFQLGGLCRDNSDVCTTDQTISWLKKALRFKSDYLSTYLYLGDCYKEKHLYTEALDAYQHAATLAMPFTRAVNYDSIADVYFTLNQPAAALPYLEKAVALRTEPAYQKERRARPEAALQEASIYLDLGAAYLTQGENKKAIEWFRGALVLNPNQIDAYTGLGTIFMSLKNYKSSAQAFQEALKLDPQNDSIKNNLTAAQKLLESSQ